LPVLPTERVQATDEPGIAPVELVVFVTPRSGTPGVIGVVSVALLFEGSESAIDDVTDALLVITVTPAGRSVPMSAAKIRAADPPGTMLPKESRQREPAWLSGVQLHPGELAAGLNAV
jgi:hypothetical protein